MITKEQGILNGVPAGGYVVEVVKNSSADSAGIKKGDIIVSFDGKMISEIDPSASSGRTGLAELLGKKKIGDKVEVEIWRDEKSEKMSVELRGEG